MQDPTQQPTSIAAVQEMLRALAVLTGCKEPHYSVLTDGGYFYLSFGSYSEPISDPVWSIIGKGATVQEAYDSTVAQFTEKRTRIDEQRISAMAASIMQITYQTGGCSVRQLRQDHPGNLIDLYLDRAIERANAMSERAPFTVVRDAAPDNGAPELIEEAS